MLAGKLEKGAVLKAICSGFEETTEPAICLSSGTSFVVSQLFIHPHYGCYLLIYFTLI